MGILKLQLYVDTIAMVIYAIAAIAIVTSIVLAIVITNNAEKLQIDHITITIEYHVITELII